MGGWKELSGQRAAASAVGQCGASRHQRAERAAVPAG